MFCKLLVYVFSVEFWCCVVFHLENLKCFFFRFFFVFFFGFYFIFSFWLDYATLLDMKDLYYEWIHIVWMLVGDKSGTIFLIREINLASCLFSHYAIKLFILYSTNVENCREKDTIITSHFKKLWIVKESRKNLLSY